MTTASAAGPALVISGGQSATDIFADLWISYDGVHWTMPATIAVSWSQRYLHGLVFHAPTACLYVMGGDDGGINSELNDVWRSSDSGHTWTQLTAHAAWSGRSGFALISWGGLLRLFGGGNDAQNPPENVVNSELWTSVDGIQWSRVLAAGVPSARTGASFVGLDTGSSPLLALVGGYLSASATGVDIRISSDGVNWCAPANAAPTIDAVSSGWQALGPQSAVVWNTTIVFSVLVTNASNTAPGLLSITQPLSLLCDSSAVVWQLLPPPPFAGRCGAASLYGPVLVNNPVVANEVLIIGGTTNTSDCLFGLAVNDVWTYDPVTQLYRSVGTIPTGGAGGVKYGRGLFGPIDIAGLDQNSLFSGLYADGEASLLVCSIGNSGQCDSHQGTPVPPSLASSFGLIGDPAETTFGVYYTTGGASFDPVANSFVGYQAAAVITNLERDPFVATSSTPSVNMVGTFPLQSVVWQGSSWAIGGWPTSGTAVNPHNQVLSRSLAAWRTNGASLPDAGWITRLMDGHSLFGNTAGGCLGVLDGARMALIGGASGPRGGSTSGQVYLTTDATMGTNWTQLDPLPLPNALATSLGLQQMTCESPPVGSAGTNVVFVFGGYTGVHYSTDGFALGINPCNAFPCMNGGTCHNAHSSYTCACGRGFSGTTCATPVISRAPARFASTGSSIVLSAFVVCLARALL